MRHAIRMTTALFAVLGALGIAQAEGGPGDSGAGSAEASASATTHAKKAAKTGSKRANRSSSAASGAKADGPMSNASVGKGG
jgi:hypothetical protein